MGKTDAEVIALFNEQVNMTADELETWLDDPQSREAGTGVGIESGRRIVEILRKNPDKKPDGYGEVRTFSYAFIPIPSVSAWYPQLSTRTGRYCAYPQGGQVSFPPARVACKAKLEWESGLFTHRASCQL
jgi:Protein of unknown function (DUF3140)